ncbi:hypothetical protein IVA79_01360 [Bradyrhizobium sp. 138]|uniref:hypothetical protein n=1 Tax=Bradyrhizobium sp. 138 TaxID=2782615 RepID=UPI001FFB8B3B|nr:hypothetical protein [Bradyrhizobium sp. 138]MCK1732629.1 hypothetical protein [Bradyrhizobium sp. 138]
MATAFIGLEAHPTWAKGRVACAIGTESRTSDRDDLLSKSNDRAFDNALVVELERILRIIPVNPGFKYVKDDNAFATDTTIVTGTTGTVLIGLKLVNELLKPDQGGVAVACVLAHECSHIFQFFSVNQYYERLEASTQRLRELHADLLAGFYMGKRMGAAAGAMRSVEKAMMDFGDYNNADPKDHGTPGQRSAALDKGYVFAMNGLKFDDAAIEGEKYVRVL